VRNRRTRGEPPRTPRLFWPAPALPEERENPRRYVANPTRRIMRLSPRSIAERTVPVSLSSSAVRQRTGVASVSSPSPPPSPLGRGKRSLRFRRSRSPRLVAARDAVFPLPAAIGGSWNSPLRVGRQISDGGTLRVRESCEMHERIKNRSRSGATVNSTTGLF